MKPKILLYLNVVFSLLVLLIHFFHWTVNEYMTSFQFVLLSIVIYSSSLIIVAATVVFSFSSAKNWKHLSLPIITIIAVLFFPFDKIIIDPHYSTVQEQRMEIVDMITNDELSPKGSESHSAYVIELPEAYEHLSAGGEVYMEKENTAFSLLFLSNEGFLDTFSGIIYSSIDQKPQTGDFNGQFRRIDKIKDKWYSASAG